MSTNAPVHHRVVAAVAVSLLAFAALPAAAQKNGNPNPGSPPVTHPGNPKNSDRGNFPPGKPGNPNGNGKGNGLNASVMVVDAGNQVATTLRAGGMTADGRPIAVGTQRSLLQLLSATSPAPNGTLVSALTSRGNQDAAFQATALASGIQGLLRAPEKLPDAVASFDAFVNASSAEFLKSPPPEFLAVRAALAPLAAAAASPRQTALSY